jgi:3-oxoacyl-[acyl-carrier-protein] synthase III
MLDRGPTPWLMEPPAEIGLKGIGWYLGEQKRIAHMGHLLFRPDLAAALEARGFRYYTRSTVDEAEMAVRACRETFRRSGLCPADIDAVVVGWAEHRHFDDMQERLATRIVRDLGFHDVHVVGIGMSGCCLYAEMVRMARNMIVGEGYRNVLVVEVNRCHANDTDRVVEPDWYVYCDGAASCIVTTQAPEFALKSVVHVAQALPNSYEVGPRCAVTHRAANSREVCLRALRHAGLTQKDIKQYLPPNASPHLIKEFTRRIDIPFDRVFLSNVHWIAHPWSCDTVINLYNHCQYEPPTPGDNYMAFAWAEGSFSAMVLERTAHPMLLEPPEFPFMQLTA